MKQEQSATELPPQHQQRQPGLQTEMTPRPEGEQRDYVGSGKLEGQVAIVTGGDSGIGRAVAVAFAKEGADIAFAYLDEHDDANETKRLVEEAGRRCIAVAGDLGDEAHAREFVDAAIARFGRIDVVVNNAAEQHPQKSIDEIDAAQLEATFRTNVFAMFHVTRAALPQMKSGARIVNTTSVTAYRGSAKLLDYSATKGAIVSFTRSLSQALAERGIRVNAVAPGPIWTPLIPSTFSEEEVAEFGSKVPMKRPGQPDEVARCFVFLASDESSYMTGQVMHPNGGEIING